MNDIMELLSQRGEQRYGQLIWNALAKAGLIKAPEGNWLFYISDEKLEMALREMLDFGRPSN